MAVRSSVYTLDEILVKLQTGVEPSVLAELCGYKRTLDFVKDLHKQGFDSRGNSLTRYRGTSISCAKPINVIGTTEEDWIRSKIRLGWSDYIISNNLSDFERADVIEACKRIREEIKAESEKVIVIKNGACLVALN